MKRFLIPVLFLFACITLLSLQSASSRFENKSVKQAMRSWRGETGFYGFGLPAGLARVFVSDEDPDLKEILREIRMVHFLVYDHEHATNQSYPALCRQEINSILANNNYKNLLSVKSNGSLVNISVKHANATGIIREVIIMAQDKADFIVMRISGTIHTDSLLKLARQAGV